MIRTFREHGMDEQVGRQIVQALMSGYFDPGEELKRIVLPEPRHQSREKICRVHINIYTSSK